jgi:hypothetical protein
MSDSGRRNTSSCKLPIAHRPPPIRLRTSLFPPITHLLSQELNTSVSGLSPLGRSFSRIKSRWGKPACADTAQQRGRPFGQIARQSRQLWTCTAVLSMEMRKVSLKIFKGAKFATEVVTRRAGVVKIYAHAALRAPGRTRHPPLRRRAATFVSISLKVQLKGPKNYHEDGYDNAGHLVVQVFPEDGLTHRAAWK